MLPLCEVKRGADHFFKIEHSDQEGQDNWNWIHQITSKTKEDFRTKDDSVVSSKDFEVFCILFRGIELAFAAPPKKVRSKAIVMYSYAFIFFP